MNPSYRVGLFDLMHISIIIRDASSLFPAWLSSLSTSAMSLLYECVNTVIAGELCCYDCSMLRSATEISCCKVFDQETNLLNALSNIAVLISLSSGMPNHSASIQVSLVLLFLCC